MKALEESFGHRERVDLSTLTIEHILPQAITNNKNGKAWKEMFGEEWEQTHDSLLHTLGNLTLTGYNTELSNSPFETKQIELAKSHLDLNAYFTSLTRWNADAIRRRSVALTERALALWPRPASGIAYSRLGRSHARARRLDERGQGQAGVSASPRQPFGGTRCAPKS